MDRKVGWYVWVRVEGKKRPECVSGCFETRVGAETYQRIYKANYPESNPYIEQNAQTQELAL